MTQRIRMANVERRIHNLNVTMGRPTRTWDKGESNLGNYHLYSANSTYSLHVIANYQGGVHNLITGTLREVDLYVQGMMHAAYELKTSVQQ